MQNKEFLEEVLNSDICPKDFEKIYHDFEQYQDKALDTLWVFHDICEKNNIPYSVAYGSLLGLIRDGGQIPWDYDVDVCVPFEKRNDLIAALEKDLPEKYYYKYVNNDQKCRHLIMRLAPVGYKSEILHVDVFFFVGTPDDSKLRQQMANRIRLISNVRYYKYVNIKEEGYKDPKFKLKLIVRRVKYFFFPLNSLMKEYYSLCEKYPAMTSKYNIAADLHASLKTYKADELWDTTLVKTASNHELRAPIKYEEVLANLYGDYKKIPKLENRIKELLFHYQKLVRSKIEK